MPSYPHDNNEQNIEEAAMLQSTARGDSRAFDQLMEQHWKFVFNYALQHTKSYDKAEIITQDLFIRLWRKREDLRDVMHFKSYLFTCIRNQVLAAMRERKKLLKLQELGDEDAMDNSTLADRQMELNEFKQLLRKGVDQLPEQQRNVFELARLKGYSYREVARTLQIAEGTVAVQLSRATNAMKHYLRQHGVDPLFILLFIFL